MYIILSKSKYFIKDLNYTLSIVLIVNILSFKPIYYIKEDYNKLDLDINMMKLK